MVFDTLKKTLENYGYKVNCFIDKEQAAEFLNQQISGKTVGFGGSVTSKELGLFDSLGKHNTVFWHWRIPEGQSKADVLSGAMTADVYISSVNALAESGEIVNIDGAGNRIASLAFGHKKIYYIVGRNKIVPGIEEAVKRARTVAAPLNAKRLSRKTPCAVDGSRCFDCNAPERICRTMTITWRPMKDIDTEILLIDEDLGL